MRARVRIVLPDGRAKDCEATGAAIRLGHDADCEVAIDPVALLTVSGVHARIDLSSDSFALVHLSVMSGDGSSGPPRATPGGLATIIPLRWINGRAILADGPLPPAPAAWPAAWPTRATRPARR